MRYIIIALLAAIVALGCESAGETGNNGSDGDTDTDTDSDTDVDTDVDSDSDADGGSDTDSVCDELDFNIELAPVNLMILQDMSYSMADPEVANPTNWSYALPALNNILTDWADSQIVFGFDIFPDGSSTSMQGCHVDDPVIYDCGPDVEIDIVDYINDSGNTPNGASTPLYCGIADFIDPTYAPVFNDPAANRYLLVVSDGADLCGEGCCTAINPLAHPECTATTDEFEALAQDVAEAGIKIIVIGFGVGAEPDQLNAIANNGGMDAPYNEYIFADDDVSLEAALTEIAATVITCVYNIGLPDESADPNLVNFYFDDDEDAIPYDEGCAAGEGWMWVNDEHTQIEFCADACELLQGGTVEQIKATWGCPTVTIE